MTFRDTINYLLQSLEIGQVDARDQLTMYLAKPTTPQPSFVDHLVFRTVERGVRRLVLQKHYTFDQQLSERDIRLLYAMLRRSVKQATLPVALGDDYIIEIRQEALAKIDEVIEQHQYLRRLFHKRNFQPHR